MITLGIAPVGLSGLANGGTEIVEGEILWRDQHDRGYFFTGACFMEVI
jgi:hypothetical protein